MSIEMSKETEEKLMKALSNDPVVKISNLNIQMKVSTYHRDYMDREDMLISISELDEDIFTMANERALLKAIEAYINDGGES
jgi:hypothetical protein